jgi:glycine/D-amino acid oxidase-like deaminating enzyme
MSLVGNGYIAKVPSEGKWHVGSTYERDEKSPEPDLDKARRLIEPKLRSYIDLPGVIVPTNVASGIRVFHRQSHLPLIVHPDKRTSIITGLGSRGLLYHALLARDLTEMVASTA